MGRWKSFRKFLLRCCCIPTNKSSHDSDSYRLPADLRDPRNQDLLPKEKTGCRGSFLTHANGQVMELPRNLSPAASTYSKTDTVKFTDDNGSENSPYSTNQDAELPEANREMFRGTYGSRILAEALADDKSSSDGSSQGDAIGLSLPPLPDSDHTLSTEGSENEHSGVPITSPVSSSSPNMGEVSLETSSNDENANPSDESHHNLGDSACERTPPQRKRPTLVPPTPQRARPTLTPPKPKRRTTLVAARRTTCINPVDIVAANSQIPFHAAGGSPKTGNISSDDTAAATIVSDNKDISPERSPDAALHSGEASSPILQELKLPTLKDNPEDFRRLVEFVTNQLESKVNPLGEKVMRMHNCDDGCLWSLLFPPRGTNDECKSAAYLPPARPVVITQLPSPQRAVISYIPRSAPRLPPIPEAAHGRSTSNDYDDVPQ